MSPTGSVHRCNIVDNGTGAFWAQTTHASAVYDASSNWWGVTDSASIESLIYHKTDDPKFPTVIFVPFAETAFVFDDPLEAGNPAATDPAMPSQFALMQNHPNPFNLTTNIDFYVPRRSHVSMFVHNILGRQVKLLLNGYMPAGHHSISWDGTDSGGRPVSSGVYFYRMSADGYTESRKMLLLK